MSSDSFNNFLSSFLFRSLLGTWIFYLDTTKSICGENYKFRNMFRRWNLFQITFVFGNNRIKKGHSLHRNIYLYYLSTSASYGWKLKGALHLLFNENWHVWPTCDVATDSWWLGTNCLRYSWWALTIPYLWIEWERGILWRPRIKDEISLN